MYPLPYYLVNPFPRYKHAIEPEMILLGRVFVLGSKPGANPLAASHQAFVSRSLHLCGSLRLCG